MLELITGNVIYQYLFTAFVAMIPVIELRGAIPIGVSMGLPLIPVTIVSVIGNMIPVPLIILFVRKVFAWLRTKNEFCNKIVTRLEYRADEKSKLVFKYELLGLMIFVAIPLPGTGAWTGALIAGLFNIRLRVSFPTILAGVCIAGVIICLLTGGVTALF